jgi:hypothetical protein
LEEGNIMILGLSFETFTQLHVIISIVGILSGLIVAWGLLQNRNFTRWAAVFLVSTILTSLSGFPIQKLSFLQPLAPTQSEPPFLITQGLALLGFAALGFFAAKKFRSA